MVWPLDVATTPARTRTTSEFARPIRIASSSVSWLGTSAVGAGSRTVEGGGVGGGGGGGGVVGGGDTGGRGELARVAALDVPPLAQELRQGPRPRQAHAEDRAQQEPGRSRG